MPARLIDRLDEAQARAAKPGMHPDGSGLYLHVSGNGARSWVLRYRISGKRRDMGLGSYPLFNVRAARKRADEQRRLLADGVDPLPAIGRRRSKPVVTEKPEGMTFAQVVDLVIGAKRSAWGPKQERDWWQTLRDHALPTIGHLPIASVGVDHVEAALRPIWSSKPVTAKRVRQRIEAVLDYATVKGHRSGDNPARWNDHLEHVLAADAMGEPAHHEALPYAEIDEFMLMLPDTLPAQALKFCILTAARTGEVHKATWSEIDLEARVWTVPAAHMKGRREHKVPLSDDALAILAALPRTGDRVFPIGERALWHVVQKQRPGFAVHGFRATFRTWAQEATNFPSELAEHCLAHIEGSASELAYKRGDAIEKRRQVMDAWAEHCTMKW